MRVGTGGVPRSGFAADKNNFAPRVGLAWTLGHEGNTVLRAGYGIYYDQSPLAPGEALYFNAPYFDFNLFFSLPGLPLTLNNPFPSFFPFPLPDSALAIQRNLRTPYMQHWSANVQQQLGQSRVLEIAYVGSKGTKLLSARDINQPPPSVLPPGLPFVIHHHMLTQAGVHHIENAKLDELARDRVWLSCTIVLPLLEKGAAGSAIRPVAIGAGGKS